LGCAGGIRVGNHAGRNRRSEVFAKEKVGVGAIAI
jgi:hypothetical protein